MVAIPLCPTHQPAGAAWYRCKKRTDTLMPQRTFTVHCRCCRGIKSQLNPLVPQSPERLGAARFRVCTSAAVLGCRRTTRPGTPVRANAQPQIFPVGAGVGVFRQKTANVRRHSGADRRPKARYRSGNMYREDMIAASVIQTPPLSTRVDIYP